MIARKPVFSEGHQQKQLNTHSDQFVLLICQYIFELWKATTDCITSMQIAALFATEHSIQVPQGHSANHCAIVQLFTYLHH